jgi:ABC-2 type transport system ATP-binding protein
VSAPFAPAAATPALELRGASRWYGNVVAINDVSFSLAAGITGLLGPNGAGKSTLLHMMAGFLAPSAGSVLVEGRPAWRNPEAYRALGLVPEREAVQPFLTAREFVRFNAVMQGVADPPAPRSARWRRGPARRGGPEDRHFSKGMRQRAKVAGALVHEPRILLLDEPFNGMDPGQRLHMMELLRAQADAGRTVLISSHILEELDRLADSVLGAGGGAAGRVGALPGDPAADDGPPAHLRPALQRRPPPGRRALRGPSVAGAELSAVGLTVRTEDRSAFAHALPKVARAMGVTLREVRPSDESLESVFSYLVTR